MKEQIEAAKALLIKEGYFITKISEGQEKRMDDCAEGRNEDCCGCICSICILQD